jgi:hypothetical protein
VERLPVPRPALLLVLQGAGLLDLLQEQTVYRVTVEDGQGCRRTGWVRGGGWLRGLLSDTTEVHWDD